MIVCLKALVDILLWNTVITSTAVIAASLLWPL